MVFEWLEHFMPVAVISAVVGFAGGFAMMMGGGILVKYYYEDMPYSVWVMVKGSCVFGMFTAVVFIGLSGALAALPLFPLPEWAQANVIDALGEIGNASYVRASIYGLTIGVLLIVLAFVLNLVHRD